MIPERVQKLNDHGGLLVEVSGLMIGKDYIVDSVKRKQPFNVTVLDTTEFEVLVEDEQANRFWVYADDKFYMLKCTLLELLTEENTNYGVVREAYRFGKQVAGEQYA